MSRQSEDIFWDISNHIVEGTIDIKHVSKRDLLRAIDWASRALHADNDFVNKIHGQMIGSSLRLMESAESVNSKSMVENRRGYLKAVKKKGEK